MNSRLLDTEMRFTEPHDQIRDLGYGGPRTLCQSGADVLPQRAGCVGRVRRDETI